MKRRDFLRSSVGLAGLGLPVLGWAQTRPCPPGSLHAEGGSSSTTACAIGGSGDWLERSTGRGVIWAHRFDSAAEVNQFRVAGNDDARWVSTDGASTPGCLELVIPRAGPRSSITNMVGISATTTRVTTATEHGFVTGQRITFFSLPSPWSVFNQSLTNNYKSCAVSVVDSRTFEFSEGLRVGEYIDTRGYAAYTSGGQVQRLVLCGNSWRRTFAPLVAGSNGKSTPDPACNETLARFANWPVVSDGQSSNAWWNLLASVGHVGHRDYWGVQPNPLGDPMPASAWIAEEYYLQFRVKIPSTRFFGSNQPPGKLLLFEHGHTGCDGELVFRSMPRTNSWFTPGKTGVHALYASKQFRALEQMYGGVWQPGPESPYNSSCRISTGNQGEHGCWWTPADEWHTVLLHVRLGHHNDGASWDSSAATYKDSAIEMWVARSQPSYRPDGSAIPANTYIKVLDYPALAWWFGGDRTYSHSGVVASGYMNEVPAEDGWYHRFDEMILSKEFIPCPSA